MVCKYTCYIGGKGYICDPDNIKCPFDPPDFEKCAKAFKNKITKKEQEQKQ